MRYPDSNVHPPKCQSLLAHNLGLRFADRAFAFSLEFLEYWKQLGISVAMKKGNYLLLFCRAEFGDAFFLGLALSSGFSIQGLSNA